MHDKQHYKMIYNIIAKKYNQISINIFYIYYYAKFININFNQKTCI